ncbi:unnamed protein product [Rodentolepis nana]|uniref:XPG_I_2 domain-containing protein n=1 Tax=Rodentolepis nana TaxID=102285 RepID=A0A0R3TJW6_RODNA|nr:unnamed protein product [Rodentolepis nana]
MFVHKDTWTLVEHVITGFQSLPLSNGQVVIHGHDFYNHVIYLTNHPTLYGGNYSQLRNDFVAVLKAFDECKIRPVFVFGGVAISPQSKRNLAIDRLQRRVNSLQQDPSPNSDNGSFLTPVLTKEILLDVLREKGVPHVTCDSDIVPACVALAAHLRCPLLANCCELLFFEFEDPGDSWDRFVYIPLRYLSFKPIPRSTSSDCMSLSAHVFSPSKCSLHQIPHILRPFFAIYFKPPTASHFPIPHRVYSALKHNNPYPSRPMIHRAMQLISWLRSANSPLEVLEESLSSCEGKVVISFIEDLVSITSFLKIDLDQGKELSKFLFPDSPSLPATPYLVESVDLVTHLLRQPCPDQFRKIVTLIESESSLIGSKGLDLLTKLPPYFLKLYRDGYISTVIFGRLLSSQITTPIFEENLSRNAASDSSMCVRFLQYCLALDFIKDIGFQIEHFEGSDEPHISEFSRSTDVSNFIITKMKLRSLSALPANLDDLPQICAFFIQKNIGCQVKSVNNWIDILALTLTVWHKASHKESSLDILEQPTALAIALIASVLMASNGVLTSQHLDQIADGMPHERNVNILHEISELQLLYISFFTLMRFFSAVVICKSTSYMNMAMLKLPQGDCFFSNSRLIHNLAAALAESPERKSLNVWIKKILSPVENSAIIKNATMNLMMLTRTVCEMRSIRPMEFDPQSEIFPFPVIDNQQEKNRAPSVINRQIPRNGSSMRGKKVPDEGNFSSDNGRPNNLNSRNRGPSKPSYDGNRNRKSFPMQMRTVSNPLNPFASNGNEASRNPFVNKDIAYPQRNSMFACSNSLQADKITSGVHENGDKDSVNGLSFNSKNPFLPDLTKKGKCAASEIGEKPKNVLDFDARNSVKSSTSEFGYRPHSGPARQAYSRPGSAVFNQTPFYSENRIYREDLCPRNFNNKTVHPGRDTMDPRKAFQSKSGETTFRKPFSVRQQSVFQPKPSFNNFPKRGNSNANGGSRGKQSFKPMGRVSRVHKNGPQENDQSKWKTEDLAVEIEKLALEFK